MREWKVCYCAGPDNLQLALEEAERGRWLIETLVAHAASEPRYTLVLHRCPPPKIGRGNSPGPQN